MPEMRENVRSGGGDVSEEKARRPSWKELDAKDKRERARLSRQMLKDLRVLLTNTDGFARLRSISDEEWAAVAEGDDDAA